jgi:C-terminal processing protease CtpA/Prc
MIGRALVVVVATLAGCGEHAPAAPTVAAPTAAPRDAAIAQTIDAAPTDDIGFGPAGSDGVPAGWGGGPPGTLAVDEQVRHGAHRSVRIARDATSPDAFSALRTMTALQVAGATIELRGFLKTQDVKGVAGLWIREDGDAGMLALDNMAKQPVTGTTEWTAYVATVPLSPEATRLVWGALLQGEGTAWAADLQLFVDGKPIAQAPPAVHTPSALDGDHEFDHGSHIAAGRPSAIQLANLVTLAKVWGFLKYHHPAITAGQRHWDYDLLRTLPAILAAPDRATANAALVVWVHGLGDVAPCRPCAKLPAGLETKPDLAWIDDRGLGAELAQALRAIYGNRVVGRQFYVSLAFGVGNPQLHHEPAYDAVVLPDAGFQLLGLFRLWNIIEYWAPDRALADAPWDRVLADAIPEVMAATTAKAYLRAIQAVIARVHDGHAGLTSREARPPDGDCRLPVELQFIGRHPVVRSGGSAGGLAVGDEITAVGGVAVDKLIASWTPYYAASNEPAQLRDIARTLTVGECAAVAVDVRRAGRAVHLSLARGPIERKFAVHDQPGPTFRLLSPDLAYLKLSSVVAGDSAHYIDQAAGTKGLVIDIRNYPSEFVVFALGSLLVDKETPFAVFTNGDLSNPGAFAWADPIALEPAQPHYPGKVVVLVDEVSQSQAEYTTMAFRAAHAVVVGSTTAGADGNVSNVALPGNASTWFSGIGVFYPDRKPTQGIGIVADVKATPTIAGIAAGRDEVLEAGIRQIVGTAASAAEIEKLARPSAGSGGP